MKSRLRSSGPCRRLLVINAAILLLANCFILAQSEETTEPEKFVETSNWLSTVKGSWPSADTPVDGAVKKPFYAFHTDASTDQAIVFRLKPDFFKTEKIELASQWDLKFRYSTDSQTTIRSESGKGKLNVDKKLDPTNSGGEIKWKSEQFSGKNEAEWKTSRFLNYDNFLIAFKDLKVHFMEKATTDKLEQHNTALNYNTEPTNQQNNVQKYESVDPKMSQIQGDIIYGTDLTTIELVKPIEKVEFIMKIVSAPDFKTIVLTAKPDKPNLCEPSESNSDFEFKCTLDPTKKLLHDITVHLKSNLPVAFVAGNLKGATTLAKDTDYNILKSTAKISSQVYQIEKIESDKAVSFVNVIDSQPDNGDSCYRVYKSKTSPAIDVYLNLPHVNNAILLTSIAAATDRSEKLCLNNYVALQNMKDYQITLVVKGKVTKEFQFVLSKTTTAGSIQLQRSLEFTSEIAQNWYYYNPSFDYSISGKVKKDVNVKFEACDVVGNCVPYVLAKDDVKVGNTEKTFEHKIDPRYKDILKESQYIRIKTDVQLEDATAVFKFNSAKNIAALEFKKQFEATFADKDTVKAQPPVPTTPNVLKYKLNKFNKDNQVEVKIPFDAIDLRVHQLKIKINFKAADPANKLRLIKLDYQNGIDKTPFEFVKDSLPGLNNIQLPEKFAISSDDFFSVEPTQLYSAGKGKLISFVLELKTKQNTVPTVDFEFEVTESASLQSEIPDKLPKESLFKHLTFSPALANNAQTIKRLNTAIMMSGWISAGVDQTMEATAYKTNITVALVDSTKPLTKKPIVYRVILGQHNPIISTVKTEQHDDKKLKYTFLDDISNEEDSIRTFVPNGPFKIGYFVHSNEEKDVKVTFAEFKIKSPAIYNAEANGKAASTLSHHNGKFAKSICPVSFGDDAEKCQLKYLYRLSERQCDEKLGCSNIFDHTMLTTNLYAEDAAKAKYIPYQVNANDGTKLNYLQVNKKGVTTEDFCVTFDYASMNSSLLVSTGEVDKFHYILPTFSKNEVVEKRKICASYLTNEPKNVKALFFKFDKAPLTNVNEHFVKFNAENPKIEESKLSEHPAAFQEGIYANNYPSPLNLKGIPAESIKNLFISTYFFKKTQFILGDQWSIDSANQKIKFLTDLPTIKTKLTKYGDKHVYVDTIRTRWIKAPKANNQQLRLGFKITDKDSKDLKEWKEWKDLFDLTASVSSTGMVGIDKKSKSDLLGGKIVTFNAKSPVDYYEVSIDLSFDLSKFTPDALKQAKLENLPSLEFYLESFTVNDPCVDDSNEVKLCTKKESGSCARLYEDNKSKCDCIPGNKDDQCQTTDYCAINAAGKCNTKENCESHPEIEDYKCKCADKFVWDTTNKECLESAKLICKTNEIYSVDAKKCICIEGTEVLNKTLGICEVYKPCDKDHRALKGIHSELCKKNTECVPFGNKVTDYYCKCTGDFVNAKGGKPNSECVPKICASCDQSCVLDSASKAWKCDCNKGYELQDGKCKATAKIEEAAKKCISDKKPAPFLKADGSCGDCISGFYYDTNAKACLAKAELASMLECPKAEFKDDNMPGCVCEQNQFFNTVTRKCEDKCSEKFEQDCASREAICEFKTKTDIKCKCKDGEMPYSTNTTNAESWKCVSICDFLIAQPENYNGRCATPFSSCSKADKLTKIDFKDGGDSKTISGKVFLFNKTKIDENNSNYCKCDLGFKSTGTEQVKGLVCEPSDTPTHTIQGMEFDIDPAKVKDQAYLDKTKDAFVKLIVSILKITIEPHHIVCEPNGAVLKCSISFESKMDDKIITKKLQDACVPVEGGKCIYLTPKKTNPHVGRRRREVNDALYSGSASADADYTLVSKPGVTVTSKVKNFCDDNPCAKYSYSKCVPKPVKDSNTLFECLCEDTKFIKWDHDELIGSNKLRMQVCSVKNMCKEEGFGCKDATCHFQLEKIGAEYKPETFCSCPKTGLTLADNTLSCGQTCDGKCSNSESCAYEDRKKEHSLVCNCKEGFSGLKCEKKASAEATSKAYLISTIVVSVIAVLALIGLGVLYFKRK